MSQRTAVKVNKKERSWQAINGETHDFGPGRIRPGDGTKMPASTGQEFDIINLT